MIHCVLNAFMNRAQPKKMVGCLLLQFLSIVLLLVGLIFLCCALYAGLEIWLITPWLVNTVMAAIFMFVAGILLLTAALLKKKSNHTSKTSPLETIVEIWNAFMEGYQKTERATPQPSEKTGPSE